MAWLVRRLLLSLVLLWMVVSVVFISIYLVPGDPAEILLSSDSSTSSPEQVEALREKLGLNRPIHVQYFDRISSLLRLDLGTSIVTGTSIAEEIGRRLPRTLELIAAAGIISLLFGIPAGVIAGLRRGARFDKVGSLTAAFAQSLPVFVVGTLFVFVFAQTLRLVPAGGYVEITEDPWRHFVLLLMPSTAIAIGLGAIVYRITRSSVLEVLPQDYVRTAHSKGIPRHRVIVLHILRNALMPVVTVFALSLGGLLSGTVLIEYVFNWPGLSGMLIKAVYARDYPAVTGVLTVTAALFILINLLVDIIYAILDPRVRK